MPAGFRSTQLSQWIPGDKEPRTPRASSSIIKDPFFDRVSLLLPMTGTNGSTTFVDQSQYGATITANGGAQVSTGTFSSGAYLGNGTNSYLSLPGTNQELGGDFTIEGFIRLAALPTVYAGIVDVRAAANTGNYLLGVWNVGGVGRLDFVASGSRVTGTSLAVPVGSTAYIACERFDGVISLYVDSSKDAATWANGSILTPAGGTMRIGSNIDPGYVDGQLRWLRITKAARNRGTSTPPILPLSSR